MNSLYHATYNYENLNEVTKNATITRYVLLEDSRTNVSKQNGTLVFTVRHTVGDPGLFLRGGSGVDLIKLPYLLFVPKQTV